MWVVLNLNLSEANLLNSLYVEDSSAGCLNVNPLRTSSTG